MQKSPLLGCVKNMKILLGYILVSNQIMKDGKPVGFFYREQPDNGDDSGWRVMSGDEPEGYEDVAANFALYNAATVVDVAPEIAPFLTAEAPGGV
ncbi:MAG: DUF2185 domain-containing protein [Planctomycetaceae bacterium]